MLAKSMQLLVMCLLFLAGLIFIAADAWASNRTAVYRIVNATESMEVGRILNDMQDSIIRAGVAAFWVSSWLATGFMVRLVVVRSRFSRLFKIGSLRYIVLTSFLPAASSAGWFSHYQP